MLTLEQAALLYRSECVLIFNEILNGDKPLLENGLCHLINGRTGQLRVMDFDDNNGGCVGYTISSFTMTGQEFSGYFGRAGVWSAKRLGWLCGVVAMTDAEWVARVKLGAGVKY